MWFNFDSSPFKHYSALNLKKPATSEDFRNIVEVNKLTIDGDETDELLNEYTVLNKVPQGLIKKDKPPVW